MKILVIYYSRTGHTRKIATRIAENLKADKDEILDLKNRKGLLGWISGGKDAFMKKQTEITNSKNPEDYDLIIIGTPVWSETVVPAVRSYLIKDKDKFKKIAFFCTCGIREGNTFREMESISGKPITTLEIKSGELDKEETKNKIEEFCENAKK